jgi:hypothetical protein
MTLGRRDWFVVAAGWLVLVSSFLPWWVLRVRVLDDSGTSYQTHYGTAWRMSTRWSAAVLIAVSVAALWLIWRRTRGSVPLVGYLVALAAIAVSIFLAATQWRGVEAWPPPGATTRTSVTLHLADEPASKSDPFVESWMARDQLRSFHSPGLYSDVGWGLWVGLGGMLLVGVSIIVADSGGRVRQRRRTTT